MSNTDNKSSQKTSQTYAADTLGMPAEEMRRLGYQMVDLVVDRLAAKETEAVLSQGSAEELQQILGGTIPQEPSDAAELLKTLASLVLQNQQHGDHPRFFARVPGPSSFAAVLGQWMATGHNTISSAWAGSTGPSTIELVVIDWLRELLGMPDTTEGVLVSGGSMANLTAIATARSERGDGVVYLTDQTHASIKRALKQLGFSDEQICVLPSDDNFQLSVESLSTAIEADQNQGKAPLLVIATAGTTNTGAVDPLHKIADLCEQNKLWLHIDGAYGGPAAFCQAGQPLLAGIERADSVVLDPHKWLFQPYDIGCLMVRHPGALARTFSMSPEYLQDVQAAQSEVDFFDRGLELTRRARAIQLWMTFKTYGFTKIQSSIERGIHLAEYAEQVLRNQAATWEVITPASLGIVTFALKNTQAKKQHQQRALQLADSGFAVVSTTTLNGHCVLRLCTINPLTTEKDIEETLQRLAANI